MIRVNQIKLPIGHTPEQLAQKICKLLHIKEHQIQEISIAKRSIDARKKPNLQYVYAVDVAVASEAALQKKIHDANIVFFTLLAKKLLSPPVKIIRNDGYRFSKSRMYPSTS